MPSEQNPDRAEENAPQNSPCKEHEEAPLLGNSKQALAASGVKHTTFNLMNTFIGAGMMSLPHAFASMGVFASIIIILGISYIAYIGQDIVIRACHLSGWRTYTELVHREVGVVAGVLTQIFIVLSNFGAIIVYLIMLGDIFVGTEENNYGGVLPSLFGDHSGSEWYLSRWFVTLMICIIGLQPLVIQQRLHNLAGSSTVAVSLATSIGVFVTILAIVATSQGTAAGLQLGINNKIFEPPATRNNSVNILLDSVSVVVFAYVANYNLPPLMEEMKDYSMRRMLLALKLASGLTCILYGVVSFTTASTFGSNTKGDILLNLSSESLSSFMSPMLAEVVGYCVTTVYGIKLILIYPMENWCIRENVSRLLGRSPRPTGALFYAITYGITIAAYLISLCVKSVYTLVGFVGSTASCFLAIFLPALLIWKMEQRTVRVKLFALFLLIVSIILCFHGTIAQAWLLVKKYPIYSASSGNA